MPAASPSWDVVNVHGTWLEQSGRLKAGKYTITVPQRLTSAVDDTIIPAGVYLTGPLNTVRGTPSLSVDVPATDDPQMQSLSPWKLNIVITFDPSPGGPTSETFNIDVPVAAATTGGVNLRTIVPTEGGAALAAPSVKFGVPNGVAVIDAQGRVLDGSGNPVVGGSGGGGASLSEAGAWKSITSYTAGQVVTYQSGRYLTPLGAPASAAFDLTRWVYLGALSNTI